MHPFEEAILVGRRHRALPWSPPWAGKMPPPTPFLRDVHPHRTRRICQAASSHSSWRWHPWDDTWPEPPLPECAGGLLGGVLPRLWPSGLRVGEQLQLIGLQGAVAGGLSGHITLGHPPWWWGGRMGHWWVSHLGDGVALGRRFSCPMRHAQLMGTVTDLVWPQGDGLWGRAARS